MDFVQQHLGEILALMTALTWACAVILFKKSGEQVHPVGLNMFKNVLGATLLIPTIWIAGDTLFYEAPVEHYLILLLSGALGIGLADTMFFKCLNAIGAGLTAIIDCLYSPFVIGLSFLFLGETLNFWQFVGAVMIISAVLTAAQEGRNDHRERRTIVIGLLWGAAAMATTAIGVVMAKPVLDVSPLMWVTEIRLFGGILVLLVVLALNPRRRMIMRSVFHPASWGFTLSSSFVGAYLAMILWLGGMKYTQASTAAALNQTTTIFIFILAAIFLHEKMTKLRLLGVSMGVGGALLVTFG